MFLVERYKRVNFMMIDDIAIKEEFEKIAEKALRASSPDYEAGYE